MGVDLPGFSAPAAGFDQPLEMLAACHRRLERQCATLVRLARHLATAGSDAEARAAAAGILRYFDTAAAHHHADEEEDLFPALRESMAASDAVCLREITDGLAADHDALEAQWRRLRPVLEQVAAGEAASLPAADVSSFVEAYQRHIGREEHELLPMAARLLSDESLASIGQAMRLRRGIDPA